MCGSVSDFFDSPDWFDKVVKGVGAAGAATTAGMGVYSALNADSYANESDDGGGGGAAAAELAAAETRRRMLASRTRQKATSLTGGTGLDSPAKTSLKTLFGGR